MEWKLRPLCAIMGETLGRRQSLMRPRGIRLNNPGNIRHGDPWQGLSDDQPDPEFCRFSAPRWGVRALARVLITYRDRHNLTSIREIIGRWAPPLGKRPDGSSYEQNTEFYIRHVVQLTGFTGDEEVDVTRYEHARPLVEAIIRHENGEQPYSGRVIDRGLEMAGIEIPKDPLISKAEGQAAVAVGSASAASALAEIISSAAPAVPVASALAENSPWVIALGILVAAGLIVYTRWVDNHVA